MKRFFRTMRHSLMARLVWAFFVFLLLTVSLMGYLAYIQATHSLTESIYDRLHAVATLKEDNLNRWVDQQRLNLVFIAWQPEVRQEVGTLLGSSAQAADTAAARASLADYLKFVVTSASDSDELFIMDLNGKVILSTQPAHEGQSLAQSLFFQQGRSATYVQPVYNSPNTLRPTITVSTPMFDKDKRRVAVLAGHLNLARVDRIILERTGLGRSGETYLVNQSHEFVSAALFLSPNQPNGGKAESKGIDEALNGKEGTALYTNYEGIPVIGVYKWLDDRGVALIAEMSQEEAFAPARQLAATIIEFGMLSALVLSALAYLMARRIARPILAITRTAERVAAGDLSQTAPVITDDEVGHLALTFNQMTSQLKLLYEGLEKKVAERTADLRDANHRLGDEIAERERIQEQLRHQNAYLAALHETTLGLISRLDLSDLLETLVLRAGELMNTEHGYIYLVEPGADEIICQVGVGVFTRLIGFHVPMGEGMGGTVWQTGQPLVINDYDHWTGRAKDLEYNLIRSIIGIPLFSAGQVIGVIGLAYLYNMDSALQFGENEIELLSRFAQLASIAMDNARLFATANAARAAAEAANESKSAFLANVSHELRTPLTSILGFARIVQKRFQERIFPLISTEDGRVKRAADQVEENLKIILSEGDRLTTLINDLLDLEKIRAGKMVWKMQPLAITDVVDRAYAATASLFESKGLVWAAQVPAGLPLVKGDRDRLVQVCINLISNAVKFTEAGTITCSVRLQGQELVVSFTDQGIGIAKEDQAIVFEKFQQVGDTLTNKPKGTGLGLPICKEIVEHHGGRMWLESEPGQGSTFFFSLPGLAAPETLPAQAPVEEPRDPGSTLGTVDIPGLLSRLEPERSSEQGRNPRLPALKTAKTPQTKQNTILVVDDDANIRKLLRQELEPEQFAVLEAANGQEALELVRNGKPDLLILDILLPGMNGMDVASALRVNPETRDLPIVVVSILQDRERGDQLGVDSYFAKPINIPALLQEVRTLLATRRERKKVLVIDEDASTVEQLSQALIGQGYQVTAAYSGEEGIDKALADQPDMIIANSFVSRTNRLVQVLRFEKGMENIIFLLFR